MKQKNTMDEISYVAEHIYWMLLIMILYKNLLMRCLEGCSFGESKAVLWGLVLFSCAAGICRSIKKRRNWKSMAQNIILPFGIYTVLAYFRFNEEWIGSVLMAAGILSIIYTLLIFLQKVKSRKNFGRVLKRRFVRAFKGSLNVFTLAFAVILCVMGGGKILGSAVMQGAYAETNMNIEDTLENHRKELEQLKDGAWEKLTVQERLDVLQTLAKVERNYLGISHELNVEADNLQENVLGYYKDSTHEIVLNLDVVMQESSWKVLYTVCHEVYHCYQYKIVEVYQEMGEEEKGLMLFDRAKVYENEFANYVDGSDDIYQYAKQECEEDANAYADAAFYEYYTRLNE